jgi:hypothetical protein
MKFWTWPKSSPYFVVCSNTLATFLVTAIYNWAQSGTPAFTVAEVEKTALAALGVVIAAFYHQYTNTPQQAKALVDNPPAGK